jgi:hypothetical protein
MKYKSTRTWLSDDPEVASYVQVEPQMTYNRPAFEEAMCGADLTIADCNRVIHLEFGNWGRTKKKFEANRKKNLKKIKRLREALDYVERMVNEAELPEIDTDDYL